MTLLESIVAFVILALVGLACLDLSRGALALERSSAAWTVSVARAESALAAAESGVSLPADLEGSSPQTANRRGAELTAPVRVSTRLLRDNLEVIEVAVPLANGNEFMLPRLVHRQGAAPRIAAVSTQPEPSVPR